MTCWFTPIGAGGVKQTNLSIFYYLGKYLRQIDELGSEMPFFEVHHLLFEPYVWLNEFVKETADLGIPDSRKSASHLASAIGALAKFGQPHEQAELTRKITGDQITDIQNIKQAFEGIFNHEYRRLDVYTVTQIGIYDTRSLLRGAEQKFPKAICNQLPLQAIDDFREAGKCLSFDLPTACAFHACRATEAVMRKYYEVLACQPWPFPRNDWKVYEDQLRAHGAPSRVIDRLMEIRDDRNAYIHPDVNVSLDQAPTVFDNCANAIFQMGSEMAKNW